MELNEVVQRVFKRHMWLIVFFVIVGLAAGIGLHVGDTPKYAATSRFVLDIEDPTSQAASQAIADTARGIATGPATVQAALDEIDVDRDAVEVAIEAVDVAALGSSGVLSLTVIDEQPQVAVALSDALVGQVIDKRHNISEGQIQGVLLGIDAEVEDLNQEILVLTTRIDRLGLRIAQSPVESELRDLRKRRAELDRQRTTLVNERTSLQVERGNVSTQNALRPRANVVDEARLAPGLVPSGVVPDAVLGALLGLFVGVAIAGARETFHPTLVGRDAIEREMQAPLLGELPGPLADVDQFDLTTLATHVELAAATRKVEQVELVAADRSVDLSPLADRLMPNGGGKGRIEPVLVSVRGVKVEGPSRLEPVGGAAVVGRVDQRSLNGHRKGCLVLVTPTSVVRADLQPVADLLAISELPLLGIITYERGGRRFRSGSRRRMQRAQSTKRDVRTEVAR